MGARLLTGLLIFVLCIGLLVFGTWWNFSLVFVHAHLLAIVAVVSLLVAPLVAIAWVLIDDPGWSVVAVAATPLALGVIASLLPGMETGRPLLRLPLVSRRRPRGRERRPGR